MKHASKLVVLLVVTALLLGLAGAAGAATFSDIDGKTGASDIIKLNALGIIDGYQDGSFKPDGNITRAEFSKIAVIAAGMKDSADMLKGATSQFSDVKVNEWYTGWINLAASQGFLKGYPDGTFKPNANINYSEVITVLMRILGYNDNLPGDWPVDYLIKASVEGVTKNIPVVANTLATRENVVRLASKTLETTRVVWDKQTEQFNNTNDNKTLLAKYFDGSVTKDQIVSDWKYNTTKKVMEVNFIEYTKDGNGNINGVQASTYKLLNKDAKIAGANDVSALTNKFVDYLTNKDGEIVWISVKDYGTVSTMSKDGGNFASKDANSTQIKIFKTNYNLANNAIYDNAGPALFVTANAQNFGAGQKVTGAKDKDGNIAYVYVENPGMPGIFDSYTAATKKATLKKVGDQPGATIDLSKKDGNFRILRNGVVASIEDVKKGDLVVFANNDRGYDVVVEARSNTVTGTVSGADSANLAISVGGKEYKVAGAAGGALPQLSTNNGTGYADYTAVTQLKDIFDKKAEVTLSLDELGKVAYILTSVSVTSDLYAVINKLYTQTVNGNPELVSVELVLSDGVKATYAVDKANDWAGFVNGNLIKYALKDAGKIDKPTKVDAAGDLTGYNKDLARVTLDAVDNAKDGDYFIKDNTVVFDLKGGSNNDEVKVVSAADFKKGLEGHGLTAINVAESVYVVKDNYVQYLVVGTGAADVAYGDSGAKKGVIAGKSYTGKYYVTINEKGVTNTLEMTSANVDDYGTIKTGDFVDFTLSGGKVSALTITETKATSLNEATVEKVDAPTNSFKIEGGSWYAINKDTVIYNVSGDTPAYVGFDAVAGGSKVVISAVNSKGVLDWIIIK